MINSKGLFIIPNGLLNKNNIKKMKKEDFKDFVEEVKHAADIVEVVGSVIELKKKGKDFWAPCPFHADGDPSFSVIPAKQTYYCFGCKASGDALEFYKAYHKVSFIDAVKAVAGMFGVAVKGGSFTKTKYKYPEPKKQSHWKPNNVARPSDTWITAANKFTVQAFENLMDNDKALAYLLDRGINEDTISAYGLGWCEGEKGGDLYRPREKWGLPPEKNEKGRFKALWLPKGWVIPYLEDGNVIKLRIRRVELNFNPSMKYYFVPGGSTSTTVLNPDRKAFVIVESDLDAFLIVKEAGDLVGAVPLGSVAVKPDENAAKILQKSCHILNALDFDKAGAGAWPWWQQNFVDCVRWPVNKEKDPGEAWQAGVDIREWVKAGLPPGLRKGE